MVDHDVDMRSLVQILINVDAKEVKVIHHCDMAVVIHKVHISGLLDFWSS